MKPSRGVPGPTAPSLGSRSPGWPIRSLISHGPANWKPETHYGRSAKRKPIFPFKFKLVWHTRERSRWLTLARGTRRPVGPCKAVSGREGPRRHSRPEGRRAAIQHHLRESGGPAAAGHCSAKPALGRPQVEYSRPSDEGRSRRDSDLSLRRGRDQEPGGCHEGRRRRRVGGGGAGTGAGPAPGEMRRAVRRRCAQASYAATLLQAVRQLIQPHPSVVR